jgi:acyl carrier protein
LNRGDPGKVGAHNPSVIVKRGDDRRLAIVAFTGGWHQLLGESAFDFMDLTGSLNYSRILLRDPAQSWYLCGLGDHCSDFDGMVRVVRGHLDKLAPDKVMAIGTSSGGYAALLAGHLLRADYVHAFSPQTYVDPVSIKRYRDETLGQKNGAVLQSLYARFGQDAEYLDLARALGGWNGRTRYLLHVCARCETDLRRARHLERVPALTILRYPCAVHNVLVGMAHQRFLHDVLALEQQDGLVERHQRLFDDASLRRPQRNLGGQLKARIAAIVHRIGHKRLEPHEIHRCRDLVVRLGLDSMDCLEMIVALETEFGVEIDPEPVKMEDFRTVSAIAALVWGAAAEGSAHAAGRIAAPNAGE